MTSEEAIDLRAEVGLMRDELLAALKVIALQTAAILEVNESVRLQGRLVVLNSQRLRALEGKAK